MYDSSGGSSPERRAIAAVLDSISQDDALFSNHVLKGGLSLQLVFGSPRRSDDLDFNAVHPTASEITDSTTHRLLQFYERLDDVLARTAEKHAFRKLKTTRQKLSKEIPTLMTDIEYATEEGDSGNIKLQLTLSEIVCDTMVDSSNGVQIHSASVEDILAEKLKALLQQVTRDKVRSSDVFDVWFFTTQSKIEVDPARVTQYLLEKKKQWRTMPPLAKGQFRRKSVVQHSAEEYADLSDQLPPSFELVPFREAYECILRFVDRLDLPD